MYDTAKMSWNSPKAPTVSPLSDPNTPGNWGGGMPRMQQGTPPIAHMGGGGGPAPPAPMMMQRQGSSGSTGGGEGGYGPMLPQMSGQGGGGHETFRYG